MNISDIKIGLKFKFSGLNTVREIIKITDTRVIYSDGRSHFAGATNRKTSSSWVTLKGFVSRVKDGSYEIV